MLLVVADGVPGEEIVQVGDDDAVSFRIDLGQGASNWHAYETARVVQEHGFARLGGFCLPLGLAAGAVGPERGAGVQIDGALRLEAVRRAGDIIFLGRRAVDARRETDVVASLWRMLQEAFPGDAILEARPAGMLLHLRRHDAVAVSEKSGRLEESRTVWTSWWGRFEARQEASASGQPALAAAEQDEALFLLIERADEILVLGALGSKDAAPTETLEALSRGVKHVADAPPLEPVAWSADAALLAVRHSFCGANGVSVLSSPRLLHDPAPRIEWRQETGEIRFDFTLEWPDHAGPERDRFAASFGSATSLYYPSDFHSAYLTLWVVGEPAAQIQNPSLRQQVRLEIRREHAAAPALRQLFDPPSTAVRLELEVRATLAETGESVVFRAPNTRPFSLRLVKR